MISIEKEIKDAINLDPYKCYIEYITFNLTNFSYKPSYRYRGRILAWLQPNYGFVALPFYYKGIKVEVLKSY